MYEDEDIERWITWRGKHIPISKDGKIININREASHYTKKENYKNIMEKGFNFENVGSGAGTTFGKGIYFTDKENEKSFYKNRLSYNNNEAKEIKANIDTKDFLEINYDGYVKSHKDMYNKIVENLKENEKKQYKLALKNIKKNNKIAQLENDSKKYNFNPEKSAIIPILENNYPGIIINQNTEALDIITGGNQIIVYDTKRINIRR